MTAHFTPEMEEAAKEYAHFLEKDYFRMEGSNSTGYTGKIYSKDPTKYNIDLVMARKFLRVEMIHFGSRSIHSYIVLEDNYGKFNIGDILKAASWKHPATNFARGNVFYPDTYKNRCRWAGVS